MLAGVVYYSFGTILHKEFEQLKRLPIISIRIAGGLAVVEYLVDLPPFLRSLVCETLVYQRHNLVKKLARYFSVTSV